jgi:two-component system, sensor histidine kinase and response regulator
MDAEEKLRSQMHTDVREAEAALDRARALERIGGDVVLLGEIARLFMVEYPALLVQIRNACAAGDARELERAAHSLKGAAANFSAAAAVHAALVLERLARAGDLSEAPLAIQRLEAELARLEPELIELGGSGPASVAMPALLQRSTPEPAE